MSFSLFEATIPNYLQTLTATAGLLAKAEAWCAEHSQPPETLIQAQLAPDMWPFARQITATAWHSQGAILGAKSGIFTPDPQPVPEDFAGLKAKIAAAIAALEAVSKGEVDSLLGQPVRFEIGQYRMDFIAEDFFMSFSMPNFHFHAATAYGILRSNSLPIGKMDFLGKVRKLG